LRLKLALGECYPHKSVRSTEAGSLEMAIWSLTVWFAAGLA
jgi:hypothetical protein